MASPRNPGKYKSPHKGYDMSLKEQIAFIEGGRPTNVTLLVQKPSNQDEIYQDLLVRGRQTLERRTSMKKGASND